MSLFQKLSGFFKKKKEPKIVLRHRKRVDGGWFKCECKKHDCNDMSRWEDRHCVNCFLRKHDLIA